MFDPTSLGFDPSHHWPLHRLDVKNFFCSNLNLHKEAYMKQPPRFVAQGGFGCVCHLKHSLYGIKQLLGFCLFWYRLTSVTGLQHETVNHDFHITIFGMALKPTFTSINQEKNCFPHHKQYKEDYRGNWISTCPWRWQSYANTGHFILHVYN